MEEQFSNLFLNWIFHHLFFIYFYIFPLFSFFHSMVSTRHIIECIEGIEIFFILISFLFISFAARGVTVGCVMGVQQHTARE